MKRFFCLLFASGTALVFSSPFALSAAKAKPTPPPPNYTVIGNVSADEITIDTGKSTKSYKVTPRTEIELFGKKATLAELESGMRVSVTAGMDRSVAALIKADSAPKPLPEVDPKKKTPVKKPVGKKASYQR